MARTRMIAMLAALVALATGVAACGGGGGGANAEEVVESATLSGVESARFDLAVAVESKGERSGELDFDLSGAFQREAGADLPLLDLSLDVQGEAKGEPVDLEAGLTLLSDRAFVGLEGTEYEVDPTTFGFVRSRFEQAPQQSPEEDTDITACQEAAADFDLAVLIDGAETETGVDVDGQETTRVSGELDVGAAADAIVELSEDPACAAQLQAAGSVPLDQLREAKGELTSSVEKAHVDLYVGEDGIVRRVAAELVVEPKNGTGRMNGTLDLTLSEVNEDQEISAPSGAEPLEKLFQQLDINPLELLEGGEGGIVGLLDQLLDGQGISPLGGDASSGGGAGGGSGGEGGGGEGSGGGDLDRQQAYLECLKEVESASDLQGCASLAP